MLKRCKWTDRCQEYISLNKKRQFDFQVNKKSDILDIPQMSDQKALV